MEARFGHDFGNVRVHRDSEADDATRVVSASAFTLGSDVVFGQGQYAPETTEGTSLLAHELTHVVQNERFGQGARLNGTSHRDDASEREAEQVADIVAAGGTADVSAPPSAAVARLEPRLPEKNPYLDFRPLDFVYDPLAGGHNLGTGFNAANAIWDLVADADSGLRGGPMATRDFLDRFNGVTDRGVTAHPSVIPSMDSGIGIDARELLPDANLFSLF
jgi:hypothetical protein